MSFRPSLSFSLFHSLSLRIPARFSFRVFAYVNVYACPALGDDVPLHIPVSLHMYVCAHPHSRTFTRVPPCRSYASALCRKNYIGNANIEIAREFCLFARSSGNKWDLAARIGDENLHGRNIVLLNGQSLSSS